MRHLQRHSWGPNNGVTGADLSAPMLDVARQRAIDAGVTNAAFVEADAQIRRFEPGVAKLAISRFGTSR